MSLRVRRENTLGQELGRFQHSKDWLQRARKEQPERQEENEELMGGQEHLEKREQPTTLEHTSGDEGRNRLL